MIRIAFNLMGADSWQAGVVYLNDLLRAIRDEYGDSINLSLLQPKNAGEPRSELIEIVDAVIPYPPFERLTVPWAIDHAFKRWLKSDRIKYMNLRRRGIQAVALSDSSISKMPTICWLPDFQHRVLPNMFSDSECRAREATFMSTVKQATKIILISRAVKNDFLVFAPQYADKSRVVSPVSYVPKSIYLENPQNICEIYNIPEKFIYLPNQFWQHKNHSAAFEALSVLKKHGCKIPIVCTGYPGDMRHPRYFADILGRLARLNIKEQVTLLGLVPREHLFALIRQSICVLNPSLFEGFGMTVDEARSVGKQVLVSDIPAHREQDAPGAVYFDPRDPVDLAKKLERIWHDSSPGPDSELESKARADLPERRAQYARSFVKTAQEAIAHT